LQEHNCEVVLKAREDLEDKVEEAKAEEY